MKAYVYYLLDPRTQSVRYVGCTQNPNSRFSGHLLAQKDSAVAVWIQELRSRYQVPIFSIRCVVEDLSEARRLEARLIDKLRFKWNLLNVLNRQRWKIDAPGRARLKLKTSTGRPIMRNHRIVDESGRTVRFAWSRADKL